MIYTPQVIMRGFGDISSPASIQQQITAAANAAGIPPSIALGVAQHESGFNPSAQNPGSSAAGLFQLTAATQQTMGVTNPFDPTQNIQAGVDLLSQYYNTYGNWNDALQAFSDGPGTVGNRPPSSQTQGLVSYVQNLARSAFQSPSFDLASSFTLPDFSSLTADLTSPDSTLISGVPDWVVWAGIGIAGASLMLSLTRG